MKPINSRQATRTSLPVSKIPTVGRDKEKRRSLLTAPRTYRQKTSIPSPTKVEGPEVKCSKFKVGDLVSISGVKHGVVRYFGRVHFAEGEWFGIELGDDDGKHNGSIEGVKYFECASKHGIFAPSHKVCSPVESTTTGEGDVDTNPKYRDRSPLKPTQEKTLATSPSSRESSKSPPKSPLDSQTKSTFGLKSLLQQPKSGLQQPKVAVATSKSETDGDQRGEVCAKNDAPASEQQNNVKASKLAKPRTSLPKPASGKSVSLTTTTATTNTEKTSSDSNKRSSLPRFGFVPPPSLSSKEPSHRDRLSLGDSSDEQKASHGGSTNPMTASYHEQAAAPHWQIEYKRQASFEQKRSSGIPRPGQRKSVSPPQSMQPVSEQATTESLQTRVSEDKENDDELDQPYEVTTPTRVNTQTALTLAYDTHDHALGDCSSSDGDSLRGSRGSSPRVTGSPPRISPNNSQRSLHSPLTQQFNTEDSKNCTFTVPSNEDSENSTFTVPSNEDFINSTCTVPSNKPNSLNLTYDMDLTTQSEADLPDTNDTFSVVPDSAQVTHDEDNVCAGMAQQLQSPIPDLLTPSALYAKQAAFEMSSHHVLCDDSAAFLDPLADSHVSAVSSVGILSDDQLCNNSLLSDEFRFTREQIASNSLMCAAPYDDEDDPGDARDLMVSPTRSLEGVLEVDLEVCSIDNPDLATPDITSPSVSSVNESDQRPSTVSDHSATCELNEEKTEAEEVDLSADTHDGGSGHVMANRTYDLTSQPDVTRDAQNLILGSKYSGHVADVASDELNENVANKNVSFKSDDSVSEISVHLESEAIHSKSDALSSTFEIPSCDSKSPVQRQDTYTVQHATESQDVDLERASIIKKSEDYDCEMFASDTSAQMSLLPNDLLAKMDTSNVKHENDLADELSVSLKQHHDMDDCDKDVDLNKCAMTEVYKKSPHDDEECVSTESNDKKVTVTEECATTDLNDKSDECATMEVCDKVSDTNESLTEEDAQLLCDLEAGHSRYDRPISMISSCSGDTGIVMDIGGVGTASADRNDVSRKERPVSLISTSSADTGYQPDTDSEMGTLTANSPSYDDCSSVASGNTALYHSPVKPLHTPPGGAGHAFPAQATDISSSLPGDSDLCSDAGTLAGESEIETDREESDISECMQTDCVTDTLEELSETESQQDSLEDNDSILKVKQVPDAEADSFSTLPLGGADGGSQQVGLRPSDACSVDSLDSVGLGDDSKGENQTTEDEVPEVLGIITPDREKALSPGMFTAFPESSTENSSVTSPQEAAPKQPEATPSVLSLKQDELLGSDSDVTRHQIESSQIKDTASSDSKTDDSVACYNVAPVKALFKDLIEAEIQVQQEESVEITESPVREKCDEVETVHSDLKESTSTSQLRGEFDKTSKSSDYVINEIESDKSHEKIEQNITNDVDYSHIKSKDGERDSVQNTEVVPNDCDSRQRSSRKSSVVSKSDSDEKLDLHMTSTDKRGSDGEFHAIQIAGACVVHDVEISHMNNNKLDVIESSSESPEKRSIDEMCDFVVADCHDPQESRSPPVSSIRPFDLQVASVVLGDNAVSDEPVEALSSATSQEDVDMDEDDNEVTMEKMLSPVKESAETEMTLDLPPEVVPVIKADKKVKSSTTKAKVAAKTTLSNSPRSKVTSSSKSGKSIDGNSTEGKKQPKSKVSDFIRKTSAASKVSESSDNPKSQKNISNKTKVESVTPVKKNSVSRTLNVSSPAQRKLSVDKGNPTSGKAPSVGSEQKQSTITRKISVVSKKPEEVKKTTPRISPKKPDVSKTPTTKSKIDLHSSKSNPTKSALKLTETPAKPPTPQRKISAAAGQVQKKLDARKATPTASLHSPRVSVTKRTASPAPGSVRSSTRSSQSNESLNSEKNKVKTNLTGKLGTRSGLNHERSPSVQSDATSQSSANSQVSSQGSKARQVATESRLNTSKRRSVAEVSLKVTNANNLENTRRSSIAGVTRRPLTSPALTSKVKRASIAGVTPPVPTATSTPKKPTANNQKSNKSKTSVRDIKRSNQPDLVTNSIGPTAQEISRLEALCETRTKELNYVKMQLRTGIAGFDAMAVLIKYLTEELDAFSCPRVTEKLNVVTEELQRVVTELGDLKQQKDKLETEIASLTEQYRDQTQKIKNDHQVALSKLEHRLRQEKEQELERVIEQHSHEVTTLKSYHDKHILEIKNDNKKTLEEQALKQEEDIASLERQHETKFKELQLSHEAALRNTESTLSTQLEQVKADHETQLQVLKSNHSQVLVERDKLHKEELNSVHKKQEMDNEVLQRQHESRLYEITGRLEEIKYTLSGKVESLRLECEELRRKEQQYLDAFQRDSDIKVQIALGPYQNLPAEIESLKCVLDLKNQEVRELRCCKMELEKQLEELPKAREKIRSLEQKIENLEAIIDIKSDYEKQLSEKHIALRRRYDKESKANKRLSMDNETLSWRLSQTDLDSPDVVRRQVSRSPTNSESGSPDPSRRRRSPNHSTSSTDLDRSGSSIMSRSLERSPARKSPPRTNLRRSGTYDLQDVERIDKDLRQTNV